MNLISVEAKRELIKTLVKINFSICLDESTDISKQKFLVILVRYLEPKTGECKVLLWDLPKVFLKGLDANAGALRIFNCVIKSFTKYNIPILNIIAACTDGCETMIGDISGLKLALKR